MSFARAGRVDRELAGTSATAGQAHHALADPPTVAVVVALLVLDSATPGWVGLTAAVLPVLAALTAPHAIMAGWLDRQPLRG